MKPPPALVFAVATLGIAVFSVMDAVMKGLSLAIGAYNAILWRSLAGTVITGAIFVGARTPWPARAVLRVHLLRGGISAAMTILFFWGLARVPMAQAVALTFVAPLVALLLAALLLHERIGRSALIGSGVALAGIAIIVSGQARAEIGPEAVPGSLAVLGSALCYAWNIILMRQQAQVARPVEIAFFQTAIVAVILLAAAPLFAAAPAARHWPALVGAAALATTSLMLLSWAYARGRASDLAPSEYTAFVWASLLGWLVFSERLSSYTLAGAALIIAGCVGGLRARLRPPALETSL
ncbi:DMT family transporter [Sphingomonas sp. H39-1-10]|uniref:DMT family transporter n=1 Tax=Sphingomonas TaxID=13687 RepID=UPI000885EC30|nr:MULTISPECIES: DMT family transporter [Sphingomonas]MDF0490628.1 DMT family transporter [Sphingomonas pollutisoli]SDA36748.1 S-adenosylmethionine uptake transporter [Sphingomonas sp. NFR15]